MPLDPTNIAEKTQQYFIEHRSSIQLAFIWGFPKNCCEVTSLILGKLLSVKFPQKTIVFTQGTNEERTQHHFWLEIDNKTFDITADQFDEIKKPIYGEIISHVICKKFPRIKKTPISTAIETNDLVEKNHTEFHRMIEELSILMQIN